MEEVLQWPKKPPTESELLETSENEFERAKNFLGTMKLKFNRLNESQEKLKCELLKGMNLAVQLQEAMGCAEKLLQESLYVQNDKECLPSNIEESHDSIECCSEEQSLQPSLGIKKSSMKRIMQQNISNVEQRFADNKHCAKSEEMAVIDDSDKIHENKLFSENNMFPLESSVSTIEDSVNERTKSKKPKVIKKFKGIFGWQMFKRKSPHSINENQAKNDCLPEENVDDDLISDKSEVNESDLFFKIISCDDRKTNKVADVNENGMANDGISVAQNSENVIFNEAGSGSGFLDGNSANKEFSLQHIQKESGFESSDFQSGSGSVMLYDKYLMDGNTTIAPSQLSRNKNE